ncbi:MAG: glutathione peroxidase [Phycisphaerales bacterium]|nr:glutathione peroxidase [Phycisphaerales bacterium]
MTRIDGEVEHLSAYKGRVLLIVNVASKCGNTPQYEGLQALYESRHDKGLEILGFPANNFRGQEPGTDEEILAFCTETYGVSFPMFSKVDVIEDNAHPLFRQLAQEGGEAPTWNFTKYLVDRDGHVVARFDPRTQPNDPDMLARIDALLDG